MAHVGFLGERSQQGSIVDVVDRLDLTDVVYKPLLALFYAHTSEESVCSFAPEYSSAHLEALPSDQRR
jgi:hypothetical protein